MRTPLQRTLINLAVASACGMLGAAQAQQAEPAQQPAPDTQAAPADQAAGTAPAVPEANVVRISGSRIAARGFSQPTPTTSLSSADLEKAAKPNLFNTLAELPALTRSVLWLYHGEGYTHEEIAALMQRTASFSKSQLARGTRRLRVLLDVPEPVHA